MPILNSTEENPWYATGVEAFGEFKNLYNAKEDAAKIKQVVTVTAITRNIQTPWR
jgi:hypothetical protein